MEMLFSVFTRIFIVSVIILEGIKLLFCGFQNKEASSFA